MSSVTVDAPRTAVWNALIDPSLIREYTFGAEIESDWVEGAPITWRGEWQGRHFEDNGVILQRRDGETLRYSHYSPLSGLPEKPEYYHTVTIDLADEDGGTRVTLTQDNNPSEEAKAYSEKNWTAMLEALKTAVEARLVQGYGLLGHSAQARIARP